jgi:hypothetical protein
MVDEVNVVETCGKFIDVKKHFDTKKMGTNLNYISIILGLRSNFERIEHGCRKSNIS